MYPEHYGTSGQLGVFRRAREAAQRIYTAQRAEEPNGVRVPMITPTAVPTPIVCGPGEAEERDAQGNVVGCIRLTPTMMPTVEPTAIPFEPEPPILLPQPRPPVNGAILEPMPPAEPVVNGAAVPTQRLPWETQVPLPIPGARPAVPPAAPLDRAVESVTEGIPIQRAGMGMGGGLGLLALLAIPLLIFGKRTR